jgi:hypothetical protein
VKRRITPEDIVPLARYESERKQRRARMAEIKRDRRVEVGPFATFYFENFDTMLHQVQEMLAIEKGGDEQLADELAAYNPLIPQGQDLVATVMFEIENPERRARELARLGNVEDNFFLRVDGARIRGEPVGDDKRTREDGKTSSVHFIRFPLGREAADSFKRGAGEVVIEIAHPNYGHSARIPEAVRRALAGDLA